MMNKLFGWNTLVYATVIVLSVLLSHLDTKEQIVRYQERIEYYNQQFEEIMVAYEEDRIEEDKCHMLLDKLMAYDRQNIYDFKAKDEITALNKPVITNLFQE